MDTNSSSKIKLEIGCGNSKIKGFVGLDKRPLPEVDIVHNLEMFPYPLDAESCSTILARHVVEHIKPWCILNIMDELWRIMELGGELIITTPYAGSPRYWKDPTHTHGWTERTLEYFDPMFQDSNIYQAKPWHIQERQWSPDGDLLGKLLKIK